jgi:hypothetical protein
MSFIYKFVKNHVPGETVFPSRVEAVRQAIKDMNSGEIYPKEIIHLALDRKAIEAMWERQHAA